MYRIEFTTTAERQLRSLPREVQVRLRPHIDALAGQPRPPRCRKLAGSDHYRIRVGVYRVLCEIQDRVLVVRVERVGHCSSVYR